MWLLLFVGCSHAYLQQLESENLQLRQQLATTQTQLDLARAQECRPAPVETPAAAAGAPAAAPSAPSGAPAAPPATPAVGGVTPSASGASSLGISAPPQGVAPTPPEAPRGLSIVSHAESPTASAPADPNDPQAVARDAARAYERASAVLEANRQVEARTLFQALIKKYPDTPAAYAAQKTVDELSVVGTPAPPLDVDRWLVGAGPATSTLTVLAFWEVWCPHCQHELPELEAMLQRWKGKGVAVTGLTRLSRSATEQQLLSFVAENHISFPTGLERDGSLSTAFHVTGIPAAAILKGGVIVWRGHPARLNDALLSSLLSGD